jgi:putative transposase
VEHYRTSSHTVYDVKYHIVWITKYRRPVLSGLIATRTRELIRQICRSLDIEIIKGHVSKNHVHIFVSAPPNQAVSSIVQALKGKSSRKLMMEFKTLSKMFWGRHLWARGYFVASSGNVTDEIIMKYIEEQKIEPEDGDFKVEAE